MTRKTLLIGRSSHADIVIADAGVDADHGELVITSDGQMHLTDCPSENGTFIRRDGAWQALRQTFIEDADDLRFGSYRCTGATLRERAEAAVTEPEGTGGGGRGPSLLRSAVERDPVTGEIVRRKVRG